MRALALICLIANPATAWEISALPVCTLSHTEGDTSLTVTYDPAAPQPYAIQVASATVWAEAPVFAMRFDGPAGLTISTDRHQIAPDGQSVTVRDQGFGNVLDGLEFNSRATAILGDQVVGFSLNGAAPEVQKFRACTSAPTV